MAQLYVRNYEQKVLWDFELLGQISDGAWENASPMNHWKYWSDPAKVDASNPGYTGYARKNNYNFTSPDLLKIIGYRMMSYLNAFNFLKEVYGEEKALAKLKEMQYRANIGVTFDGVAPTEETIRRSVAGLISSAKNETSSYWTDELLKSLSGFLVEVSKDDFEKLMDGDQAITRLVTDDLTAAIYDKLWRNPKYTMTDVKRELADIKMIIKNKI